ncbi:glycosyltransferase [Psychrobacter okhotskensis]|uniref:glycosyltransferase n=1 Tax=Psychrobacter okhotskensis TaxID=212403 RepID=UPI001D122405|nr:glycosyltransferase [Psychrobacter okhotskensis]
MMQPIILLILKALEGRGAERMVTTLARAYADLNYDVHVLCLEYTRDMPLDSRVQVHVVPYHQVFSEQVFAADSKQANAYRAVAQRIDDYVLDNIGVPNLILASIYKINCIIAYSQLPNIINVLHTALSRQFQEKLVSDPQTTITHLEMVYGAHPCSCVSDGARKDLLTLIGPVNRTTTIYNPCAVDDIIKAAKQPLALSQSDITPKSYMVHVASFDSMKGHHDLLHAYAKTARSYPLVLVGKGRLESEIKQLARTLGIDDDVRFLGFQANPYPLIASAALLLLTSKFEGFGYTIVEAQALGVPVISTDCPFGPRELLPLRNLVAVGDIDGLAALMNQAVAHPHSYQVPFNQQLLPERIAHQYLQFGR